MIEGVIAIEVGRNLNRVIRTCYSFGVLDLYCLGCDMKQVNGNLFSASEKVRMHEIKDLCGFDKTEIIALEVLPSLPDIRCVSADSARFIAVGGESTTLRKKDFPRMARIPTKNKLCLTSEAALAIALHHFVNR
jgi:hypothetical protein